MNKLKLLCTAAAVFVVVGSALALNAKKFGTGTLYCKTTSGGTCSTNKDFDTGGSLTRFCGTTPSACSSQTTSRSDIQKVQ